MASDLKRGSVSGKETVLLYNSATFAAAVWTEISRARNVSFSRGASLSEVNFHGSQQTKNVAGYGSASGSFEYVRRRGVDPVYNFLKNAADNGDIVCLRHMDGDNGTTGSQGWEAPVILGEFSETASGGDAVTVTINFGLADAFTDAGVEVTLTDVIVP